MINLKNIKIQDEAQHQSHHIVSPLKIANLNLNVKYPAYTSRRYSQQQKIMSKRQLVSTPFSPQKQDEISNECCKASSSAHQTKINPEISGHKAGYICASSEADGLSPYLNDKIMGFRAFLYRNAQNSKANQQHHINFSQLAIFQQKPNTPSVLHARIRKECPLARVLQARVAINSVKTMRRANTSSDTFKSIEVNSNSKYGSTTKIGATENKPKNKEMEQIKKNLQKQIFERTHTQRRKSSRSSTFRRSRKDGYQNEYRPWQIKKGEQEHFQLQY